MFSFLSVSVWVLDFCFSLHGSYDGKFWHLAAFFALKQTATKPARPASREACCRAAVKPGQAACLPSTLRAFGAQSGVQGGERKRVSSGHNRRRRLATGSRQPKRGFDTAVSKTTIEVAGHCPCAACQTREPWHLSCHGGKTPAKPHVPLRPLPAFGGQSGVTGHCPLGERGKLADVAETEVLQKAVRGGIENGPA